MSSKRFGVFKRIVFKMFAPMIISQLKKMVEDDSLKDEIVTKINSKVDLQVLSEDQEGEIIESLYDAVKSVILTSFDVFDGAKDNG